MSTVHWVSPLSDWQLSTERVPSQTGNSPLSESPLRLATVHWASPLSDWQLSTERVPSQTGNCPLSESPLRLATVHWASPLSDWQLSTERVPSQTGNCPLSESRSQTGNVNTQTLGNDGHLLTMPPPTPRGWDLGLQHRYADFRCVVPRERVITEPEDHDTSSPAAGPPTGEGFPLAQWGPHLSSQWNRASVRLFRSS